MPSEPFYLFIDTSAYLKSKLDFSDPIYTKLRSLIDEDKVHALSSSIIKRELKSNVSEQIKCDYEKIKSCLNKCDKISLNTSKELNSLTQIPELNSFLDKNLNNLDDDLNKLITEELDHNVIDVNDMLDDYFEQHPPFSEKKKHEFPDAIILKALLEKLGDDECHIVSTDLDWKAFCEHNANLYYYDNIGSFINYCNEQGVAVTKELLAAINSNEYILVDKIKDIISDCDLDVSYDFDNVADAIAELEDINNVTISDYNIIDVDEDLQQCNIEASALIDFKVTVSGDDYSTAMYDKEDNVYHFFDDVNLNLEVKRKINIQIQCDYTYDENHRLNIEINEIEGIVPITIEYSDYDKDYPLYK